MPDCKAEAVATAPRCGWTVEGGTQMTCAKCEVTCFQSASQKALRHAGRLHFCLFVHIMIQCKILLGLKRSEDWGGFHYLERLEITVLITSPRLNSRRGLLKGQTLGAEARGLGLFLLLLVGTSIYSPSSLAQSLGSDAVWVLAPAFPGPHA